MVVQIKDYGPPQTEVTITRMDANDTLLRRHRGESFLLSAFRSPLPRLLRLTLLSVLVLASCQQSAKEQPAAADPEPTSQKTADPPSEPELEVPTEPGWLVEVTASSGIDFTYHAYESGSRFMPAIIGAGLALFDADRDGDLDLYLVQGTDLLPSTEKQPDMPNRFFRQESPWQFVDATAESGLGDGGFGIGATTGDFDNDGWTDIYVGNFGPDVLYRNRGDGTFENVTEKAGITVEGFTASCAFADIDRDGDLDLFVTQYIQFDPKVNCTDSAGQPEYCGPEAFTPARDILLLNDGDGTFTDISTESGIASLAAASLGICCDDFNGDGWIDFYVANDAYENNLWINQKDGTFVDEAGILGVSLNLNGQEEAGMGVIAEDLDGNGIVDLFVTHLDMESNTFYRNLGGQMGFTDDSGISGLGPSSMNYTGFGVVAFDLELDGDLDLFVANGRVRSGLKRPGTKSAPPWDHYSEPNLCYLNSGSGRFVDGKEIAGDFCSAVESSRGLAAGDIDGDGDLDVVISNIEGPARLYRNDAPRAGSWLRIRATDRNLGKPLLGTRIIATDGDRTLVRTISAASSYATATPAVVHLGAKVPGTKIVVHWPSGEREEFNTGDWNRTIDLYRGEGKKVE
ncbi:MAG: hypothetical protein CMJ95_01080 [Planctomycetes bacterium]|nr:hypothetical protein [Planctomycetota bacterium]